MYRVQLDDDGEFTGDYQFEYTTPMGLNTIEVPNQLTENKNWCYRVQTVDDGGLSSGWSGIQDFWVNAIDEPPSHFELYAPTNNSTVTGDSLTFSWASTVDADPFDQFTYTLQYSVDMGFTDNIISFYDLHDSTLFIDPDTLPRTTYFWRVKAIDSDGLTTWGSDSQTHPWSFQLAATGVKDQENLGVPEEFVLYQNYPNPFNPQTTIHYVLPRTCHVTIGIFNALGQNIKTLVDEKQTRGDYRILWDGKDDFGKTVDTGIYMYSIKTDSFFEVRKMLLIQ
jgi:hypothetical protein